MRILILWFLVLSAAFANGQQVTIGVLGLFHPQRFVIRAVEGEAVVLRVATKDYVLETSSGNGEAAIEMSQATLEVKIGARSVQAPNVTVSDRSGGGCQFLLAVPGKITRRYDGVLSVRPFAGSLLAEIHMDLETAVASVVAAENGADVPLEAAKAQAIAARSFLVAGHGRHKEFDFCDSTHCQFLREPPIPSSIAAHATALTNGLILTYRKQPVAAMYSRSCGGRTRTLQQLGLPAANYPYHSVDCVYCRNHPERWQARFAPEDAELLRQSREVSRLELGRRLGWNTVPSTNVTLINEGNKVLVTGIGRGHGIGLCQIGAKAMAEQGSGALEILAHYYPDTGVKSLRDVEKVLP